MTTIRKTVLASLAALAGIAALSNHRKPWRADKIEAVGLGMSSVQRRYRDRYTGKPSRKKSKFLGFRKVRWSRVVATFDQKLVITSSWVRA